MKLAITVQDLLTCPEINQFRGSGVQWFIGEWEEHHSDDFLQRNSRVPQWFLRDESWVYADNRHFQEYWIITTARNVVLTPTVPVYHYIVLNRKPRPHRQAVMDRLEELGSLSDNPHSWLEYRPDVVAYSFEDRLRREVRPRPVRILDQTAVDNESLFQYPPEQDQSAMALALEPKTDTVFITEKTYAPLARGQLTLSFGGAGTVQRLRSLGFEFPEAVDFSYDQVTDLAVRVELYAQEVTRLAREYTPPQLTQLYEPYRLANRQRIDHLSLVRPRAYREWSRSVPDWAPWAGQIRFNAR